jgi:antitoxin FitA
MPDQVKHTISIQGFDTRPPALHNGSRMKPQEASVTTITVKRIPEELYTQLKALAAANRRSINNEIIVCIEQAVARQQVDARAIIDRARSVRRLMAGHMVTEEEISQAKRNGRP